MRFEFAATLLSKAEEKVSQVYYKHGLICCTNPFLVILCSLFVVSLCCYPLLGIHLFRSNHPQQYITRLDEDGGRSYLHSSSSSPSSAAQRTSTGTASSSSSLPDSPSSSSSLPHSSESRPESNADSAGTKPAPRWFQNVPPFAYVQQIVVKSAVIPWKNNLILMDAIRAPLAEVFSLVQFISNYHTEDRDARSISLNDLCLQVSEPVQIKDTVASSYLPHFSCLTVSPANVWKNDLNKFLQDATIINTLYSIKHLASPDSGNLREILFGEQWMETGIKRLFVRTRQRTISYVITVILSKYDAKYMKELKLALRHRYPLNPFKPSNETVADPEIEKAVRETQSKVVHLHFQDQFSLSDYVPLVSAYVMLFLYIYFSVRKIDLIRCKWALAFGSVLTVMLSLSMTIGICLWLDINPRLSANDISPYLVVIIGLENMLVLTKSIVSTPVHLDIKVRVAQGLSREGPTFTKNLGLEVSLLIFGYFTFVPVIQEFCLFGMIGFLADFFLQLTFFATILSVDIQRVELFHCKKKLNLKAQQSKASYNSSRVSYMTNSQASTTSVFARPSQPKNFKLPKRLRFVYFWASTRIFHRLFMICLLVWINFFVLKSGLVDQMSTSDSTSYIAQKRVPSSAESLPSNLYMDSKREANPEKDGHVVDASLIRLTHYTSKHTNILSAQQWFTLFGYYNISLSRKYVSILPSIHLSIPIDPNSAVRLRHPSESDPQIFRQFLSPAGGQSPSDPNDDLDDDSYVVANELYSNIWTPPEIILAIILSMPTIIFLVYVFVTLYRCMCSRNYAEWRASWSDALKLSGSGKKDGIEVVLTETLPVKLQGHDQEIELIASSEDTPYAASICMAGSVRVWDVLSGECHTLIKRASRFVPTSDVKSFKPHHKPSGSFSSDSTYGSSPGTGSFEFPFENYAHPKGDLPNHRHSIGDVLPPKTSANEGFDFSPYYSKITTSTSMIKDLVFNAATNTIRDSLHEIPANIVKESPASYHFAWCMDIVDKYIFIGCDSGHFEVWDALSGDMVYHGEGNNCGITAIRSNVSRVVVGYLDGAMEVYLLENTNGFIPRLDSFSQAQNSAKPFNYSLIQAIRAHREPITVLQMEASHIISGSSDHLLKVFRMDTGMCVYTLHGHCGGITCIEFDKSMKTSALSGCQVGQICVWDLSTGTCVFSLEAHQGAGIISLLATPLYFLSCAVDNKICIWDKYSGQLVHTISQHHTICRDMVLLAPNILVTAREDHIVLWDISEGTPLRLINLSSTGTKQAYIKNLRLASKSRAVVCDFGQQFCIVHFPGITQKSD